MGHETEHPVDHERRMIWVVEGEVAALLEVGIVFHYDLVFLALVAMVELAVVHRSAVIRIFAVRFVLAWQ